MSLFEDIFLIKSHKKYAVETQLFCSDQVL